MSVEVIERLHAAQGAFYAGGPEAPLRELLAPDPAAFGEAWR